MTFFVAITLEGGDKVNVKAKYLDKFCLLKKLIYCNNSYGFEYRVCYLTLYIRFNSFVGDKIACQATPLRRWMGRGEKGFWR